MCSTAATGSDTLELRLQSSDLTPEVRADISTLQQWLGDGSSVASSGLTLEALGVTFSNIENVNLVLDGQSVQLDSLLNQAPQAEETLGFSTQEDVALDGQVEASDPDGDALSYALQSGPSQGTLTLNAQTGEFSYSPVENFSGQDSFVVTISDPSGETAEQTITVDTTAVADAPVLTASVASGDVSSAELVGSDEADVLIGGPGDDHLAGHGGDDLLIGDGEGAFVVHLDVQAALQDLDGSESLSIVIGNVPVGATLSAGVDLGEGNFSLQPEDLENLTLNMNEPGAFNLSVTAIASEANGDTAQVSTTLEGAVEAGGNDVLDGGAGNDEMLGGIGNDLMLDGEGNDLVSGQDGNDTFMAGAGNDHYSGGEGFDTIDFSGADDGVKVNLKTGYAKGLGRDTIEGVEAVIGTDHRDKIRGDHEDNWFDSGDGNDRVHGRGGDDTFISGGGNDKYNGGKGFDTIDFSGVEGGVSVDLSRGKAYGDGYDKLRHIEAAVGTDDNDRFKGDRKDNTFVGNDGDDWFHGGRGADTFTGGEGADTYHWSHRDLHKSGPDTITDFEFGDRLDFSGLMHGKRGHNIEDHVVLTETSEGTMVSLDMGGRQGTVDVVHLQNVFEVTLESDENGVLDLAGVFG